MPMHRPSPPAAPFAAPVAALLLLGVTVIGTVLGAGGCGGTRQEHAKGPEGSTAAEQAQCPAGRPMRVHFYDVGQGLAALVTLPDGRVILVDAGDSPKRPGCGLDCANASQKLLAGLGHEAPGGTLALMWITHPHSDHVGGALEVLERFKVESYVDNGRDAIKPMVENVHVAADAHGVRSQIVDPSHPRLELAAPPGVTLTPIVPDHWPDRCATEPNDCSIGLRIDYCKSSVLFTGDMEVEEEALVDPHGPATLLQVGHHGSDTSSSDAFLAKVAPRYAVISAGKPTAPLNGEYCHPRKSAIDRLDRALGGAGGPMLEAYEGHCKQPDGRWVSVRTSERLWATERDGDVVLTTTGDGQFRRE